MLTDSVIDKYRSMPRYHPRVDDEGTYNIALAMMFPRLIPGDALEVFELLSQYASRSSTTAKKSRILEHVSPWMKEISVQGCYLASSA